MLTFMVFLILGLAAYRITQFLVYDSLMGFNPESGSAASEWLDQFAYHQDTVANEHFSGDDRSFIRGKIGDLLTCPLCTGFWVSAAVWFTYAGWHGSNLSFVSQGFVIFALAGFQSIAQFVLRALHSIASM